MPGRLAVGWLRLCITCEERSPNRTPGARFRSKCLPDGIGTPAVAWSSRGHARSDPFFTTKGPDKWDPTRLGARQRSAKEVRQAYLLRSGCDGRDVAPMADHREKTSAEATAKAADTGSDEKPLTVVVVVDDNAMVLMNTVIMLEELACNVAEATGGAGDLAQLGA